MRKVTILILLVLFCVGCTKMGVQDPLAYQDAKLYIDATFYLDDEVICAIVELEAAEYDQNGRMLSRGAVFTVAGNSIISGVRFELSDGEAYVSSGALKIPLSDEAALSGIRDIISLFCISEDCYHSTTEEVRGEDKLFRVLYTSGENKVELVLDAKTNLPIEITATLENRTIGAKINEIKTQ